MTLPRSHSLLSLMLAVLVSGCGNSGSVELMCPQTNSKRVRDPSLTIMPEVGLRQLTTGGQADRRQASESKGAQEPFQICDGTDDVRFSYRVSGGFYEDPFQAFMNPEGLIWFEIRGDCSYQVYSHDYYDGTVADVYSWNLVRTGTLSSSEASAISLDLGLDEWGGWTSDDIDSGDQVNDAPTTTVQIGDTILQCISCDTPQGETMTDGARAVQADLLGSGSLIESTTPRVVVGERESSEDISDAVCLLERDFTSPLLSFVEQDNGEPDVGQTIAADEASWFLQVRHAFRDALPDLGHGTPAYSPYVLQDGIYYGVFIRDDWDSGEAIAYPIE